MFCLLFLGLFIAHILSSLTVCPSVSLYVFFSLFLFQSASEEGPARIKMSVPVMFHLHRLVAVDTCYIFSL